MSLDRWKKLRETERYQMKIADDFYLKQQWKVALDEYAKFQSLYERSEGAPYAQLRWANCQVRLKKVNTAVSDGYQTVIEDGATAPEYAVAIAARTDWKGSVFRIEAEDECIILQGGALNPTGFDNPGLHGYGTAALWDGERLSWQELPGPRFCVVLSDAEEKSVVDEARRLRHDLFLRRYYEGKEKPEAPEGVEAYEALPVKVERAASVCLEQVQLPPDRMQQLVSDWLESAGDDREALGELIKEYI